MKTRVERRTVRLAVRRNSTSSPPVFRRERYQASRRERKKEVKARSIFKSISSPAPTVPSKRGKEVKPASVALSLTRAETPERRPRDQTDIAHTRGMRRVAIRLRFPRLSSISSLNFLSTLLSLSLIHI